MTEDQKKNIVYYLFIISILVMAVIYFSVPERGTFIENQIKWWSEFKEVLFN